MKFFKHMKDGGPESKSSGLFLIEIKHLFSIVILRFDHGSREAFHNHAFGAVSWLLKGRLHEYVINGSYVEYTPSLKPIITSRSRFHKVSSEGVSWALTFRGPWKKQWNEFLPETMEKITLQSGREIVDRQPI